MLPQWQSDVRCHALPCMQELVAEGRVQGGNVQMGKIIQEHLCRRLTAPVLMGATVAMFTLASPAAAATYITFDPPGSIFTTSRSISNGTVAGYFQDSQGRYHGFMRTSDGTITTID